MVNAFLYSVFGQSGGEKHANDPAIEAYRARWLDALLGGSPVQAVISFGHLGREAFERWRDGPGAAHAGIPFEPLIHPTQPEAVAKQGPGKREEAMRKMLAQWNEALGRLAPILGAGRRASTARTCCPRTARRSRTSISRPGRRRGSARSSSGRRARRSACAPTPTTPRKDEAKRATVVVVVPRAERPWHTS